MSSEMDVTDGGVESQAMSTAALEAAVGGECAYDERTFQRLLEALQQQQQQQQQQQSSFPWQ